MAKCDVASSGTYIILPRKQYKKLMKYLNENPEQVNFTVTASHVYELTFCPEDYKSGRSKR